MGYHLGTRADAQLRQQRARVLEHEFAADSIETWPPCPAPWLDAAARRLSAHQRQLFLQHKLLAYAHGQQQVLYAALTNQALAFARKAGLAVTGRLLPQDYARIVKQHFAGALLREATFGLSEERPWASARCRMTGWQGASLGGLVFFAACLSLVGFGPFVMTALQALACGFFLMVVLLRLLCAMTTTPVRRRMVTPLPDAALPHYTVLVPLFRETAVLRQVTEALGFIDYPPEKLDIKIILEEGDADMRRAVAALNLPDWFDVIIVPAGRPQTKPRALNYALKFARGELATIFDGEDIPQPNQLRLAASAFHSLNDDVVCLQAALDIYNPSENWLTRHFAAEYAGLFHVILPALAAYRLPLLLGGTSNHFRVKALVAVGAWDPFNVTEDADLGIRLARFGYDAGVLHSATFEEAPIHLGVWLRQRRRWLKGFLQTFLVHNRNPQRFWRELGTKRYLTTQVMTFGILASALFHPLLLFLTLWQLLPPNLPKTEWGLAVTGFSLSILLLGYAAAIATTCLGLRSVGAFGWTFTLFTIPAYWLLLSCAAWMAVWDFIYQPFHWHKTQHGTSRHTASSRQEKRASTSLL